MQRRNSQEKDTCECNQTQVRRKADNHTEGEKEVKLQQDTTIKTKQAKRQVTVRHED